MLTAGLCLSVRGAVAAQGRLFKNGLKVLN